MEEALSPPPTWLPRAVVEVVPIEVAAAVAVAITGASHMEDPRVDMAAEAAVGAISSRVRSANSLARRGTTSSDASSISIHPGPDRLRRVFLPPPHPMVWVQTVMWTLELQIT
jgi:hypothetical protein